MNVPIGCVAYAGLRKQLVRNPHIEALPVIAADTSTEQLGWIDENDRHGVDRADFLKEHFGNELAPITMRAVAAAGSIRTAPIACANSPVLRQLLA